MKLPLPQDPQAVATLRDFFTQQRAAVCGVADLLDEPFKSHFNAVKATYNEVLASLPLTDAVPAAGEANLNLQSFLSCLLQANSLNAMLSAKLGERKTEAAAALNSAVEAALVARLAEGGCIPELHFAKARTNRCAGAAELGCLHGGSKNAGLAIRKSSPPLKTFHVNARAVTCCPSRRPRSPSHACPLP